MGYAETELGAPTQKRSRRTLAVVAVLCMIPVGLTLFAYIASRYAGGMHLDEAFAEADRLDPGWCFEDLEEKRRPFPEPGKNGIDQVLQVRAALPKSTWPAWPFPEFDDDKSYQEDVRRAMEESLEGDRLAPVLLNAEQERVLRAEVERAGESIELARQMPNYAYGRYAVKWTKDFVSTLLPHVQEARTLANLLNYDARLRAHDNDIAGALLDVKAVLYASRALGDEETLISQLVRIACDSVALRMLERSLACGRASEAALLDLQKELEAEAQTPFFLTGLRGERACLDSMLDNIQRGEISFAQLRRLMIGISAFPVNGIPASNSWQAEANNVRFYVNIRHERAQYLHHMNQLIELAKLPSWKTIEAIEALDESLRKAPPIWTALVSSASKVCQADARVKALLRTAYTAVALERYRLAKGKWPEKLADLVPQYLSEVPLDPFDGDPLRLARQGSALIVYSISQDKQDNGGTLLANPAAPGSDVGFVLHDPANRRRPGKPFVFPERPAPPPDEVDVRGPGDGPP